MLSTDRTLTCRDCRRQFTFTASEQDFYAQKGFTQDPGRCPDCREARKSQRNAAGGGSSYASSNRPRREMFTATCSGCGGVAEVPFNPSGDRPVYCRDCFASRRA